MRLDCQLLGKDFTNFEFSNTYNKTENEESGINIRRIFDEKRILDFDAIAPFFLILVFGYYLAGFALLFEIFYFDFIKRLPKKFFNWKAFKRPQKKYKVRRIQVKPISIAIPIKVCIICLVFIYCEVQSAFIILN